MRAHAVPDLLWPCSPVLRTLARLKPTMSLEEGLRIALREWHGTSNFDRMIYYDMAAK